MEEEGAAGQRERQQKGYSEQRGVKGLYGRVNPLRGRLAGAWEDMERAAGRCCLVFSPERICTGRLWCRVGGTPPLASEILVNADNRAVVNLEDPAQTPNLFVNSPSIFVL